MDIIRDWLKENQNSILKEYNDQLFLETWNKYANGNLSSWEMSSLSFYHGEHELRYTDSLKYGIVNFNSLSREPEIDYYYKGVIPIYKLHRIAGTVIAKDDSRCSISLLTTTGVVQVKFTRDYYGMFKRQISQIQSDGTKKVVEKSWFSRGNILLVTGYRREDTWVSKTYTKTGGHQLYHIDKIDGENLVLRYERLDGEAEDPNE